MRALDDTHGRERQDQGRALRITFVLALVAFLLLAGLDVLTTSVMLAHGVQEGNPLLRTLIARSGIVGFGLVKLTSSAGEIGLFLLAWLLLPGRWRWLAVAALLAADAWLMIVAGHNVLLALSAAGYPV